MNKEKLINIILKDIEELKDISEEIKKGGPSSKLETDIALSKSTIILQEFQLLKEKYFVENFQPNVEPQKVSSVMETKTEEDIQEKPVDQPLPEPEIEEDEVELESMIVIDEEAETDDESSDEEDFQSGETDHELVEMMEPGDEEEPEDEAEDYEEEIEENEIEDEDEEQIIEEEEEEDSFDEDDEFEEEDEEEEVPPPYEKRTVGENFHSEMSLNDRMGNNNTLDQKISHSPITSLQSAIGINDRFLFIREMFDNDSALYATAIKRIDNCENIREAVDYLSSNFKIKKTETSLKFVELIKRRFAK